MMLSLAQGLFLNPACNYPPCNCRRRYLRSLPESESLQNDEEAEYEGYRGAEYAHAYCVQSSPRRWSCSATRSAYSQLPLLGILLVGWLQLPSNGSCNHLICVIDKRFE